MDSSEGEDRTAAASRTDLAGTAFRAKLTAIMALFSACTTMIIVVAVMTATSREMDRIWHERNANVAARAADRLTRAVARIERLVSVEGAKMTSNADEALDHIASRLRAIMDHSLSRGLLCDIYFTDADGAMTSGRGYVQDPAIDFTKRRWYLYALDDQGVALSEPYIDADSGLTVITLSKAVRSDDLLIGVLAADITLDAMRGLMRDPIGRERSYMFMIDPRGSVLDHPDTERFPQSGSQPADILETGIKGYEHLASLREGETIELADSDGITRSFYASEAMNGDWRLVYAVESEERRAQSDLPMRMLVEAAAAAAAFSLFGAYLIASYITRRIARSTEGDKP